MECQKERPGNSAGDPLGDGEKVTETQRFSVTSN